MVMAVAAVPHMRHANGRWVARPPRHPHQPQPQPRHQPLPAVRFVNPPLPPPLMYPLGLNGMGAFPGQALAPGGGPAVPGAPVVQQPHAFVQMRMMHPQMYPNNVPGHAAHAPWAAGGVAEFANGHGGQGGHGGGHAQEPVRGVQLRLPNYR